MKTILITGAAGYVGAVLVPKLLKKGYGVKAFDLFLYADENVFPDDFRGSDGFEVIRGEMRDKKLVDQLVQGTDCIINLAGVSNDPSSDLDPELTRQVNIDATKYLIDVAREAGVKRFISASSSSVYGIKEDPDVTEELSLDPLTVYSESKVAIEEHLHEHRGNMAAVSVRSATVCGYSPRMRLDLTVNILTHHAVKKGKITVFGGVQKRPNIHIDDITDLYVELVETPTELIDGKKFNACGSNHTVLEIAELVQKTVDPTIPIEVVPTNDLRSYHVSAKKIERELGFVAKRSLEDAVSEVAGALTDGRIANPDNDCYYNVRTMKRILNLSS